ncbi:common pilus major fimbrillin subunit EcpA, partial [Escherichia coli]|uniref:common pilus major fimbrillin subunit EcpA n=1 Tax=Escherichia coli TaxID=562 RepID=UPI001E4E1440
GDTVMIDTANGVLGGNLSPLANGYNASNRTTAQDGFTFSIISATPVPVNTVTRAIARTFFFIAFLPELN